jgi:hypothetical protein
MTAIAHTPTRRWWVLPGSAVARPPQFVPATPPKRPSGSSGRPAPGPGFASVDWYGTVYTFTPKQRAVVAALWQAWESGDLYVAEPTLLRIADSCSDRIRDLFRRHPAWNTMIVTGPRVEGELTFGLAVPSRAEGDHV